MGDGRFVRRVDCQVRAAIQKVLGGVRRWRQAGAGLGSDVLGNTLQELSLQACVELVLSLDEGAMGVWHDVAVARAVASIMFRGDHAREFTFVRLDIL